MREYIKALDLVPPLEPKDAFYGGRTEGFKLLETSEEDKKIQYYDFTSLYPYINKTGKVPLGHPKIIKKKFKSLDKYEGLIKCKILPPDNLFIPVLPMKVNDKLVFGLCRTCCEMYQQETCTHDDNARALTGTWVTDEVKVAVENGYKLLKIYEVWHFDCISQYDPSTKTKGVFTDYINTYLKLKQEASGWPDHCNTYEEKMKYIREYEEKEGVTLDYDNIKKNHGLRSLAKLMLNSFWGKFGQRSNLTQSMYVTKPDTYNDMIKTRKQHVEDIHYVNKETVHVDWIYGDNFIENTSQTNVVIAAYTTAQARLKLFETLKRLDRRAIYCDTDSCVFVTRPGDWEPPLGDFLGEFKDEVAGNKITSFVTAGPKSYAYALAHPDKDENKSICKIKGLAHNFKTSLQVNYDTLFAMITGNRAETITVMDPCGVRRNPAKVK
ncbi:uncharacterized protein LOC128548119 [Mercenaria mercenaria]|uniref:uncharacterized protein LOC128548119 n=1 Tax=Mercenaria mercenaria TaxID=6596 RepID=UPI00234F950C|nr:uncharacterized protein LOC128548119 [Mercenaria mercenaria]